MILDKSRLSIADTSQSRAYVYDFPSDDKKINIFLFAITRDGQIKYMVSKAVNDLDGNQIVSSDDTIFETTDLKAAWEKFEDYFEETEKEENPQQGQEPEVQVLMMSVEKSGKSFVFLQKQDGSQELLIELNINDADIVNKKPQFAKLDFSNDTSMQEPFNTEWLLAFVDDVQYEQASKGCSTYIIALNSIDQPGQNEPSKEGEDKKGEKKPGDDKGKPGDEPGDDKGEPTDEPGDDKGKPTDKPGDDKGKPTDEPVDDKGKPTDEPGEPKNTTTDGGDGKPDKPTDEPEGPESDKQNQGSASVNAQTVTEGVSKIAQETGLSSDDIQSALRSERIFDSFLTINKVDVNKLKSALGVSDLTKNQFIREMVKNA
jgi:hypothetical protein